MKNKFLSLIALISTASIAQTQGDLNHLTSVIVMHDSTQCLSNLMIDHYVNKNSSFINDEVKVIDFGGQVIYTETNLTGIPNWNFLLPFQDFDVAHDFLISGNQLSTVIPSFQIFKLISGNDTLILDPTFVYEYIPDPCTYQHVTGKTYIDNNGDCTFNTGDVGVDNYNPDFNVSLSNGGGTSPSQSSYNSFGDYDALIQESYFNNLTVAINPIYQFTFPNNSCAPYSYTINSLPQTGIDFVLECADVDVKVYAPSTPARPTIPFFLHPSVSNFGCDTVSGTLNLVLAPGVTYNPANSSNPADVISGDTLKWNYSNLTNVSNGAYWQSFSGGIELTPSAALYAGDILTFYIFTDVPTNDINATNNSDTLNITLVNSYDPNYKEVSPAGTGQPGYISATTETLTYTIHFQNTGNAPAINIYLIDSLEANVIPSTMRILNSSHTMLPEWLDNNILQFNFNNINLADSISNEPESHGFVTFEIDMVQDLNSGDEIKNRAYIYFDNNAPITTNYALNTIEYLSVEEYNTAKGMNPILYPNPTKGNTTITLNNSATDRIDFKLLDVSGKITYSQSIQSNSAQLELESLESGVYFYSIFNTITNEIVNGKLIIE